MSLLTRKIGEMTEYRIPKADILGVVNRRFSAYQEPAEVTGLKPFVESTIKAAPTIADMILNPGSTFITPELEKKNVPLAPVIGLGLDILSPGPGEVEAGARLLVR